MKQLVQNLKTGKTSLLEVPSPLVKKGFVLIKTNKSLVSVGTERMLVEFGKASLFKKALQQPERLKMVFDKVLSDGFVSTVKAVFNKLNQPISLGYCNVGIVIAVGEGIHDVRIGDRVASNGAHAEIVCIPKNLVAKIPDSVSDNDATFTVIGSVALHAVRLLNPALGETVVVTGLGLVGLLTAELLQISGCRVIGIDPDEDKLEIARLKGIISYNSKNGQPNKFVESLTNGLGADGVIITASTKSSEVISQAAKMSRKRGKIILTGVVGLDLDRVDFYEKELTLQHSCSYGPGRYDNNYEQKGNDYPREYVRWTENRNFQAILDFISSGKLDVKPLITQIIPLAEFDKIYGNIGTSKTIASILEYPEKTDYQTNIRYSDPIFEKRKGVIGIIGAGNFASATLLPILKGNRIKYIASANGLSGTMLAGKYNIPFGTSDYREILMDEEIDLVIIATRHHEHARMVIDSLRAGKHVFVEKPLAIFSEDLDEIVHNFKSSTVSGSLTVGFNRRFSPHAQKMKSLLGTEQMNVVATMNAGFIPASSWLNDREIGGGRIIGEACHLIDLVTYLTGSRITSVCMNVMGTNLSEISDNASILLQYENGSTGVVNYFSNGSKDYSKERIEVYSQERTLVLDNFKTLSGYGFKGFLKMNIGQDKGHNEQFRRLLENVKSGGEPLIAFEEIINVSKATLAALESLRNNSWIKI